MLTLIALLACGDSEPAATSNVATPSTPTAPAAEKAEYKGTFASDPKLTPTQVAMIPKDQLPLVRNEIFARHGRTFKTDAVREHFERQPWYRADPAYSDDLLTANDKHNAALIKSMGGGMYEHLNQTRHFETRGDYVLTWAGAPTWNPANSGCSDAELWKLDHDAGTAELVGPVQSG
jgi:hypothetical protein